MNKVTKYLNQLIVGDIFDTSEVLEAYSTDCSALKIRPKYVAVPESTDDICRIVRFLNQLAGKNIPASVTVRGAGTSLNGGCLSNSLVISMQKLNRLLEIDPRERLVRVQAGITLRELNTALSVSGLTIPIDGHENATIGGLISECPVDGYAQKYGGIFNFIERVEVILANGECLQTERFKKYAVAKKAAEKTLEGSLYCKLSKLLHEKSESINALKTEPRHSRAGYLGITKISEHESMDLMPLFVGAEGTLGIITEVILRAEPIKKPAMRTVATFKDIKSACNFADKIKPLHPCKVDLFDLKIMNEAYEAGKNLDGVIRKAEDGFVVSASFDERVMQCSRRLEAIKQESARGVKIIIESANNRGTFDEFDNALRNYLHCRKNYERVPIVTDFYLPDTNLENFLSDLNILNQKLKIDAVIFGSLANSVYSLRPKFDLSDPGYTKSFATFLRAAAYIIKRCGGTLAGGTPEGKVKAIATNEEMLEADKSLFMEIKQLFDANGVLNPDTKLGAKSKFMLTHLRTTKSSNTIL